MKKSIRYAALGATMALVISACGAPPETATTTPEATVVETDTVDVAEPAETAATPAATETVEAGSLTPVDENFLPCIVSDQGGFDDRSFNQLSYEGLQAAAQALGTEYRDVQSAAQTDFAPNIEALVDQGCNAIVTVGFQLSAATVEAAAANPDIHFIIVDDQPEAAENIRPIVYDTAQAAFMAGYLAAGYSSREGGANKVGTFGGMEFPTVTIFMDGFKQGVDFYNQEHGTNVELIGWDGTTGSFTGGFEANQTAQTTARNIIDQGVDVILPVGGPIYQSAVAAIKDSGRDVALIGVDANLYETDESTQPYIMTSILKNMKPTTKDAVVAAATGTWTNEPFIGTLENDGVGLAPFHNFESKLDPALIQSVNDLRERIISGEVPVTSYLSH